MLTMVHLDFQAVCLRCVSSRQITICLTSVEINGRPEKAKAQHTLSHKTKIEF